MSEPDAGGRPLFGLRLLANQHPSLHGLRVLGVLSVIQIHLSFELGARGLLPREGLVYQASQRVWFGMDLFFFLSGFLMGTILLQAPEEGRGRSMRRFYARRSFRIVPLYYVVLTLLAWSAPLDPLQRAQLPREYLYLTNYSDIGHVVMFWGWSLCVEEHFYLALPVLVAGLRFLPSHRARMATLLGLWATGPLVRAAVAAWMRASGLGPEAGFRYLYIPTHTRYDILLAGVLLAYVLHTERPRVEAWLRRPGPRRALLALCLAAFASLVHPPFGEASLGWSLVAVGTVTGLGYFSLILLMLTSPGPVARLLGAPLFLRLATLGYGVYLVHFPLVLLVGLGSFAGLRLRLGLPASLSFLGAVALVFLAALLEAYVFHLLVEKPALALRDRVSPAQPRSRAAAV